MKTGTTLFEAYLRVFALATSQKNILRNDSGEVAIAFRLDTSRYG